jgi:protein-tyrosine phosphatase
MSFLRRILPARRRMSHRVYWLTSDLAVSKEPGVDDWAGISAAGIRCIVDLQAEKEDKAVLVRSHGLQYMRLPIGEGSTPTELEMARVTDWIIERIAENGPVLVHCREGRGRSPLVACAALVKLGIPPSEAYKIVRRAKADVVLTDQQVAMLERWASTRQQPP